MKKVVLILAIVAVVACVLSLVTAFIFMSSYNNLRDGSPEHYAGLHTRMTEFFILSGVLAFVAAAGFIFYIKL